MNIDEKIALLEKEQRRQEREEIAKEKWQTEIKLPHTIELFQRDFKIGMTFVGYQKLLMKPIEFFDGRIKMPFIEQFFETVEVNEEAVCLESKKYNVSLILAMVHEQQERSPIKEWEKEVFGGIKLFNFYCQSVKSEELEWLDYLCYKIPTAEGKLFNVTFRLIEDGSYIIGTFNCKDEQCESMGVLLEAMVHDINDHRVQ